PRAVAAPRSTRRVLAVPQRRMGRDPASVVDPELRVRGVEGLRIADASVIPHIIRGHTCAPAIVVGLRAAHLIGSRPVRRREMETAT
ncbi:GMC oxidoreductase, partial [Streptomyces sp. NPDC059853]|uniref:GMC oxidoreductase n=1 Tax=Streptomyces sp. NPDC059853 TaxID=3346973 RepID=UPI00364D52EB